MEKIIITLVSCGGDHHYTRFGLRRSPVTELHGYHLYLRSLKRVRKTNGTQFVISYDAGKITLETSGEDVKLHSKGVEKLYIFSHSPSVDCAVTLVTREGALFLSTSTSLGYFRVTNVTPLRTEQWTPT